MARVFWTTPAILNLYFDHAILAKGTVLLPEGASVGVGTADHAYIEFLGKVTQTAGNALELAAVYNSFVEFGARSVMTAELGNGISIGDTARSTFVLRGQIVASEDGVVVSGSDGKIVNRGTIKSDDGIFLNSGTSLTVINRGTVTVDGNAFEIASDYSAVRNFGTVRADTAVRVEVSSGTEIENSGKMLGNSYGVYSNAGFVSVLNSGLIRSVNNDAITTYDLSLENRGRIFALGGDGVDAYRESEIQNFGLIESDHITIRVRDGGGSIFNAGTLRSTGDNIAISFGGSDPAHQAIVVNSGKIFGDVRFYDGDDHFENIGRGFVKGLVDMGEGADEVRAGRTAVRVAAGGGDDIIFDSNEKDILAGDAGEDQINISGGNDRIRGGTDADRFIFSGKRVGANVILDFEQGSDQIDLLAYDVSTAQQAKLVGVWSKVVGADTVIDLSKINGIEGGTLTLKDYVFDVTDSDFIWGV